MSKRFSKTMITIAAFAFAWGTVEIIAGHPFDGSVTQALALYMLFNEVEP